MKAFDLDRMKAAWQNEGSFENLILSEAQISHFLQQKSKDINQLFRKGLTFDIILKCIVLTSLIGILILFRENSLVVVMVTGILLILIMAIRYQWSMMAKIPGADSSDPVIRRSLEKKISFYHQRYIKSLYVGALSNTLVVLSGMLYYFWFKYGEIRPFQWDDYLVLAATLILSYIIGAVSQIKQHNFQVKQLESCLQEINEDTISTLTLSQQRNKKIRLILIFSFAVLSGLLLLAFFIFR